MSSRSKSASHDKILQYGWALVSVAGQTGHETASDTCIDFLVRFPRLGLGFFCVALLLNTVVFTVLQSNLEFALRSFFQPHAVPRGPMSAISSLGECLSDVLMSGDVGPAVRPSLIMIPVSPGESLDPLRIRIMSL